MNTIVEKEYSGGGTIREDVPLELKNYFLDKSPNATFIITDYPKVAKKKPKQKVHDNISIPKQKGLSEAKLPIQDQVTSKQNEIFEAEIGTQDKQVHDDDAPAKKKAKLDVQKQQQPDTTDADIQDEGTTKQDSMVEAKLQMQDQTFLKQKEMFEAHIQMQDHVIIKQNTMFEAKIKMQDQVISKQEELFEAKLKMQEQVCTNQKALFEAKIQMQEQVYTNQKAMLEEKLQLQDNVITEQNAKLQMQDNVIAEQKAKLQIQDNVIAEEKAKIDILEGAKLDLEKLMPYVIKSKLVELQVQVKSRNPNYEVVRSIGSEMKLVMELVPEKLRA
ncbi:uncharacterized protein [Rutidosis leptorrhynchoides]|uniref:uncharacterized protein n=1 Tax=Rutidosis leptorrhynchoides TaxID=125765 RepID=UPI003A9997F2